MTYLPLKENFYLKQHSMYMV